MWNPWSRPGIFIVVCLVAAGVAFAGWHIWSSARGAAGVTSPHRKLTAPPHAPGPAGPGGIVRPAPSPAGSPTDAAGTSRSADRGVQPAVRVIRAAPGPGAGGRHPASVHMTFPREQRPLLFEAGPASEASPVHTIPCDHCAAVDVVEVRY